MSVIDYSQAYAYMKVGNVTPQLENIMVEMERELLSIATPRKIAKLYEVEHLDDSYIIKGTDIVLKSNDINRLFNNVDVIAMECITLGIAVDKRIDYYSRTSVMRMIALDALANVYVEQMANELSKELQADNTDKYMTVRYSPGYGDLPLLLQPQLISELNATKRAGVIVNANNLMIPLKTITAFQGFGDKPQPIDYDCSNCLLKECGSDICPRRKS